MISVLIPVYNGEKYLSECIESVLKQTYRDFEIIVIDDGSTDRSADIARSYPEVRCVQQPHGGVARARNRGLWEAKGDVIAFLDADDRYVSDKLARQMAYLDAHAECGVCFSYYRNFSDLPADRMDRRQKTVFRSCLERAIPPACIRRRVFDQCGWFDTGLRFGEDTEWLVRMNHMEIGPTAILPEVLYERRIHTDNLSITHDPQDMPAMRPLIAKGTIHALMLKKGGKVSVIIPAFNAEKYLDDAVQSVFRQNWIGRPELIIVDNCSTDRTAEIARRYPCIFLEEPRKGAAFARNTGLAAATGDYIFFLDADDILTDHGAEELFRAVHGAEKADAVFAKAEDFISPELSETEKAKLVPRAESYSGCLPGCSLIRKSVFDEVGLFDTELSSGETVDWMMRFKEKGFYALQKDTVVLRRRLHLTNTGRSKKAENKNYAALIRKKLKRNSTSPGDFENTEQE